MLQLHNVSILEISAVILLLNLLVLVLCLYIYISSFIRLVLFLLFLHIAYTVQKDSLYIHYIFTLAVSHGVQCYTTISPGYGLQTSSVVISRRALAREGDYEMMPVCACVRACVCACVS